MYTIAKHCDVCGTSMKIKASSHEEWVQGNKSPTQEWNLAYNVSGIHICRNCALLIDNCLIRLKLEMMKKV